MRTLVLITSNYPFGTGEPFLESEFPIISREFEKTIIFSQNTKSKSRRDLPENVIVFRYNTSTSVRGFLNLPGLLLSDLSVISEIYRDEKKFRNEKKINFSFRQKQFLLKKIIKALQFRDFINLKLKKLKIDSDIVFYSYWLNSGAHAAAMLSCKNSISITRAHGHDLYEERNSLRYLPMLNFLSVKMNSIFFISEHGKKYFMERTGSASTRLTVSYLGVKTPESVNFDKTDNDTFTIVSCSNLSPLKRVGLIIESLAKINPDRKIKWLHFGEGTLRNELEALAEIRLRPKKNISYEFKGQLKNNEILGFYSKNKVDLFLNTSSAEGIPVSIMEAQSYGTPVIATDTGGVSELVVVGTGFLLQADFNPEDLAGRINYFLNMSKDEVKKIREKAYQNQKNKFDADTNYRDFIKKVNSIFESSIKQL